jgi:hypothetical protein
VYRSQQRSTDLCTEFTGILPASVSVVAMVCDPFGYLAPPTIIYYRGVPYAALVSELCKYSVASAG